MANDTLFRFGRCEVDVATRRVRLDGRPSAIEPRPFDLLVQLIRHRRRVVTKEELLETVWPRETVSAGALARAVMKARQAIGDDGQPALIRSVPRVGYRFVAALESEGGPARPAPPADALTLALLPFENATGDAALGWLELGLMGLVAQTLAGHPKIVPVALQSLLIAVQGAGDAELDARVAAVRKATGAKVVVRARVSRAHTGFRLEFARCEAGADAPGEVFADKPAELAARLADALAGELAPGDPLPAANGLVLRDPLATESFARGLEALATHQWRRAVNLFKLAVDLEPANTAAQLELLRALGNVGGVEAVRPARRLLARAERDNDLRLAARVQQALGRLYLNRSELKRADYWLEQSLRLGEGHEPPDWTARTLMLQASVAIHQLEYERTAAIVHRMMRACELSGDRILPVAGLNLEAIAASAGGALERAVELSLEAIRRARELRANSYLVDACDNAAWDLARLGRLAEAAGQAEEAIAAALAHGDRHHATDSAPVTCWIYGLARMPQAAARIVANLPEPQTLPRPEHVWRARGLLAMCEGRHGDAADCLQQAIARHREVHDAHSEQQTLPWLIEALALAGHSDAAEAEIAVALAPRFASSRDLQAQVSRGRAVLARMRGRRDEALALLAGLIDTDPAPLWRAWAGIDAAWLHAEAGDAAAAARCLEGLPRSLASHPLALVAQARVCHALGDPAGARDAQRSGLAALGAAAHPYLVELASHYDAEAAGRRPRGAALPPAPVPASCL